MLKHHHPNPVSPRRVVILGANGFVARNLAQQLSETGVPHVALGSAQVDLLHPDSIGKLEDLVQPEDALVITSALTPEKGKDVRTFMKNLTMVGHVCAFLEKARCAHVIYLSSDAVYDEAQSLVSETTARTGVGLYGLMHVAREQMLQSATAKPQIPLCVVRPCAIYGAADTHNSYGPNRFIRTAIRDRKITLFGSGEEQRDHIYCKDVCRFLEVCLRHRTEGAVNIVTGKAISFHDVAQMIVRLSPHPVQLECLPRATPITHRHFDLSVRLTEFPDFRTTPFDTGLAESFRGLSSGG